MKMKRLVLVNIVALVALLATGAASAWDPYYGYGSYNGLYRQLGFNGPPQNNNPFYRGQVGINRGWYSAGSRGYYFVGKNPIQPIPGPQVCALTQCDDSPLPRQCVDHPICGGYQPQPRAFWWHFYDWDAQHDPNPRG